MEVWVVVYDEGPMKFREGRQPLPNGDWYIQKVYDTRDKATAYCKTKYNVNEWREVLGDGGVIKMLVEVVIGARLPLVKIERWDIE